MGSPAWANNQFVYSVGTQSKHYYVLVGSTPGSNPKAGHCYPIVSNTANTLTVDTTQDSLSGIPVGAPITVIPHWTLATLFPVGDQNASFTATTSSTLYKTQILIPSYTGTTWTYSPTYFFSNNVDGTTGNIGWRIVGNNTTDHGDDVLLPGKYFVVRNANGAPTLSLVTVGAVLTEKFTLSLATSASGQQDDAVSILRPFGIALDASGLGPGNGSFVANDQLLLFDNSQVAFNKLPSATYYYDTTVGNTGGWRLTGDITSDHGADVIPLGAGFIIRKAAATGGQPVLWTNASPVRALSAVSRKAHSWAGIFDLNLPLAGNPAIECRSGGTNQAHQFVITFPAAVTFTSASLTSGTGAVGSVTGNGTTTVTVNLTGVTNAQWITITLFGVTDGVNTNDVAVRMGVLVDDTSSDRFVDSLDSAQTKSQSGLPVTTSNFREDVNVDGFIDALDVSMVKSGSGTALP
jgi:uncharacterized protein (TIGR02597 family)